MSRIRSYLLAYTHIILHCTVKKNHERVTICNADHFCQEKIRSYHRILFLQNYMTQVVVMNRQSFLFISATHHFPNAFSNAHCIKTCTVTLAVALHVNKKVKSDRYMQHWYSVKK